MTTPIPPAGWYPPPPLPPQKKKGRKGWWIAGGVAFIAIVASTGGHDDKASDTGTVHSAAASVSAASAPVAQPSVASAGSVVRDGKFEFQVVSTSYAKTVSDSTGNPYMTTTAQGTFLVVTLSVKNIGDQAQNYFGDNQKVIDVDGREYSANTSANMWMNAGGADVLGGINPGNSIQVRVAFDVPVGSRISTLEVHDSMFSSGAKVSLA